MRIELEGVAAALRDWDSRDVEALVRHADNRKVWLNLRDAFPHPYRREDAVGFIARAEAQHPPTTFAIELDGEAAGSVGLRLHEDVERTSAELGYWLAEAHWGRGITTAAVRAMTRYAFETFLLTRVYAVPFAGNASSARVLEKAGYRLEGTMRRSAIKDGRIVDQLLYAITDEDLQRT